MNSTTDKRPFPPPERERASKASEDCLVLRHPETPSTARADQAAACGSARPGSASSWRSSKTTPAARASGTSAYATRTTDPDAAAAAYLAAATRCGIAVHITPEGRIRGNGIALAYELKARHRRAARSARRADCALPRSTSLLGRTSPLA
jgi:hypothetical protein